MDARRRLLLGTLVGAAIGLLVVLWATASSPGPGAAVLVPTVSAAVGFGIVASYEGGKTYHLRESVPLSAAEIRRYAARWYAAEGRTLQGSDADAIAFTRESGPSSDDAGCLPLLGGLAALLYLLSARERQTATLLTTPVPDADGTEIEIIVSSRGGGGQSSADRFLTSLHQLADPSPPEAIAGS